ncbi:MAG: Mlc titration factor MtfA (ptsG expression regulator) [Cocleimonas sp.]|jgi:Mlc titration factor MtfA (ptsG expression regulator)
MFKLITKIKTYFILRKNPISPIIWGKLANSLPLCRNLDHKELYKLKKLTTLFLYEKTFTGVKGFEISEEQKMIIAIQACLPILYLDMSYYDGWVEIVVYPDTFIIYRNTTDNYGLVREDTITATGEAWSRGPVILAWTDVERDSFSPRAGHNVTIHEFSHKLDMLNGRANGMPPLHPNMRRSVWTQSLSQAYDILVSKIRNHEQTAINEYAATNPAEFFAVISETFFTAPAIVKQHSPDVYDQLVLFYKQKPVGI